MHTCWHARFMALPPSLRRMVAEIGCAPVVSASSASPYPISRRPVFSSTRARGTPHTGHRPFSSSSLRLAMGQRSRTPAPVAPRPAKAKKTAAKAASKSPSSRSTPKVTRSSKSTSATPKPASKSAPKSTLKSAPKAKSRATDRRAAAPTGHSNHIRALSYLPPRLSAAQPSPASDDAASQAAAVRLAPTPAPAFLDKATSLFTRPAPEFLYSAPRFLNLPLNTRIPEICILGRSNVGKSTLLNALAGLETGGRAGSSHGSNTGRKGLAITSARAGCTKMMNGYGFGPPLRGAFMQTFERAAEEKDDSPSWDSGPTPRGAVISRTEKRAQKAGEPPPAHSLILIDMPGYGFMSRSEWGTEITKYLQRRVTLRGAVLLVDAVTGLKGGDRQALTMLRDANIKTTIVITKADKLLPSKVLRAPRAASDADVGKEVTVEPVFQTDAAEPGEQTLRESCLRVWDVLRATERDSFGTVPWMEGQGWAPEICVTGAGDPRGGGFGVAGARLAICRMAGLISLEKKASSLPGSSKKPKKGKEGLEAGVGSAAASKVVPFDQIQWSETTTENTIDQSEELRYISEQEAAREKRKARFAPKAKVAGDVEKPLVTNQSQQAGLNQSVASASELLRPQGGGRKRPWRRTTSRTS